MSEHKLDLHSAHGSSIEVARGEGLISLHLRVNSSGGFTEAHAALTADLAMRIGSELCAMALAIQTREPEDMDRRDTDEWDVAA